MSPRHMSAVPSSSTNIPVDTTFNKPVPTLRSFGIMRGLSLPSTRFASKRSGMFNIRGIEKPQMSASSTPTMFPCSAIAAARFTVTELFPTPPLPLAIASTRALIGTCVSLACSFAFHLARVITAVRSSAVISPQSMVTLVTPGCTNTRDSMSFFICTRSGQPLMVSFIAMDTKPSVLTVTSPAMPKSTMLSPSSGSMTARNSSVTSSDVGGATWGLDMVKTYREA